MLKLRKKLKEIISKRSLSPAMMAKIMKNPMFQIPAGMSKELFSKAFYSDKTSDAIRYAALLTSLSGHHEKFNLTLRSFNKNNVYFVKPKFTFTNDKMDISHFVLAAVSNKYDPIFVRKSLIIGDAGGPFPKKLEESKESTEAQVPQTPKTAKESRKLLGSKFTPWSEQKTPNLTGIRVEEEAPLVEGVWLDRHVSWTPGVVKEIIIDVEVEEVIESIPLDSFTSNILALALKSGSDLAVIVDMLQWIIAAIQYLKSIMNSLRDNIFWLDFEKKYYLSGDPRINAVPEQDEYDVNTGKRTIGNIKGWEFEDYIRVGLDLMPAWDYADALPEWNKLYSRLITISALKYKMHQQMYSMTEWANTIYDFIHELVLTMDPTVDLAEKLFNIDWSKAITHPNLSTMVIPKMKYAQSVEITSKTGEMENFENARGEFNSFKDIRETVTFSSWEPW